MILYTRNNKPIEIEIQGPQDDVQVTSACYVNAPWLPVPDAVCDWLVQNYAEDIYLEILEEQIGRAEALCEGER